jgi:uncharacterized repeat protein (TIGR03843 family)
MTTTRELLLEGDLSVKGRMPWSSNATFLVDACLGGETGRAVYKPVKGERPLRDFPAGLYKREVAAYELSDALGWGIVPLTVLRHDGPLGEGSLQHFVEADFEQHYFTLVEHDRYLDQCRRICVFDLIINNTDRKSGHLLVDADDRIWAIDNGLSFHREFKLRTVIWDFGGEPIPEPMLDDVAAFTERGLPRSFYSLLDAFERDAIMTRARAVVDERCFPVDTSGRRYPWPLV